MGFNLDNECIQCGAIAGMYEMEWNVCGSCGYPDTITDDDTDEDDEDDDYDVLDETDVNQQLKP